MRRTLKKRTLRSYLFDPRQNCLLMCYKRSAVLGVLLLGVLLGVLEDGCGVNVTT